MTRLLTVIALALTLVAAGCGSDTADKNEYVNAVNKAQTDFADGIGKVQQGASASDGAAVFDEMKASVDKVVADLKAVDPPEDVKSLHDQLVSQLADFGDAVEKAGSSIESGDAQTLATAQATFAREVSGVGAQIGATIQQINAKLQE